MQNEILFIYYFKASTLFWIILGGSQSKLGKQGPEEKGKQN